MQGFADRRQGGGDDLDVQDRHEHADAHGREAEPDPPARHLRFLLRHSRPLPVAPTLDIALAACDSLSRPRPKERAAPPKRDCQRGAAGARLFVADQDANGPGRGSRRRLACRRRWPRGSAVDVADVLHDDDPGRAPAGAAWRRGWTAVRRTAAPAGSSTRARGHGDALLLAAGQLARQALFESPRGRPASSPASARVRVSAACCTPLTLRP